MLNSELKTGIVDMYLLNTTPPFLNDMYVQHRRKSRLHRMYVYTRRNLRLTINTVPPQVGVVWERLVVSVVLTCIRYTPWWSRLT